MTATVEMRIAREAIERIGWPLRTDAFDAILAGKPDFTAMILRDDEPGCSSILAQQLSDQMAEDIITVLTFARGTLRADAPAP